MDAWERMDDLLTRMQGHVSKKTPQLRALRSWRHVAAEPNAAPLEDATPSLPR